MRITVIGSGYVGLVSAACFAEIGHEVISVDNDSQKVAALARGETPIHERLLPELLAHHRGKRLQFTQDIARAVETSEAIFITVGTPQSESGEADLSFVEAVARDIAGNMKGPQVVIEKSTVPVRTCESLRRTLLLNGAQEGSFSVASNPEFLREGSAVVDFLYPDRIVIGADDEAAIAVLKAVYRPLTSGDYYHRNDRLLLETRRYQQAPLIVTSTKSAELIKHASNAFLAMKISFINAVATVAENVGADIDEVCAGVGSDSRIGPRFLNAGIGYGGSCFPKDVQAFHAVAAECNYDFGLLNEVVRINSEQRQRFLQKVRGALWTLRGKRLAVLGLAFKGGTDDIRESPAVAIIKLLLKEGAQIRTYDPAAMPKAKVLFANDAVTFAEDPYQATAGCDALLILTEWSEFANLDLQRMRTILRHPIVIDGRNLYNPDHASSSGLIYYSVGRSVGVPLPSSMGYGSQEASPRVASTSILPSIVGVTSPAGEA
ncbi:MAG TPA: UDP-glucose/GDP-mannose dehydrogenase family protein [Terriglobales bacterium]